VPFAVPRIRVEDAHVVADGGPARIVLTGADDALVAALEGCAHVLDADGGRLRLLITPSDIARAASDDPRLAPFVAALRRAVEGWLGPAPDVPLPAGVLRTSTVPAIMGVLNVTPDSFSDGGSDYDPMTHPGPAIAAGLALLEAGAHLVDVGGESTRPGAAPVGVDEELARVIPVVRALADAGALVSIDTVKADVAAAAVEAGAGIVNDVSAGRLDADLLARVASLGVPYVVTHMQGTPRTMQRRPHYDDVVAEVFEQLATDVERAAAAGIDPARLIVDPGIGFGKTVSHNAALLARIRELTSLGQAVLIGTSRKSFIGQLTGVDDPLDRLEGSLASAVLAVDRGASIVRVHDVAAMRRALEVAGAIGAMRSRTASELTLNERLDVVASRER
jgi:dihydropteroate synthase